MVSHVNFSDDGLTSVIVTSQEVIDSQKTSRPLLECSKTLTHTLSLLEQHVKIGGCKKYVL